MEKLLIILKYIEKSLWCVLLTGLTLYYPGKLIHGFVVSYMEIFIVEPEIFEGITGIKELVFIDGLAALILSSSSFLCAWLLFKKNIKTKIVVFSFLLLTLTYYLLEPLWFQLSGFPMALLDNQIYEEPLKLLLPPGAVIIFGIYFYISDIVESGFNLD